MSFSSMPTISSLLLQYLPSFTNISTIFEDSRRSRNAPMHSLTLLVDDEMIKFRNVEFRNSSTYTKGALEDPTFTPTTVTKMNPAKWSVDAIDPQWYDSVEDQSTLHSQPENIQTWARTNTRQPPCYFSIDMSFVLSKQKENEILEEMNYSRQQLKKDLELLRVWLVEQKHLPPSRLKETDNFLVHFLVGCKGSLENAKRKVDAYYSLRGVSPVFSKRHDVKLLRQAALTQYLWVSSNPLPDGTLIYMIGARNADVELYDSDNTTRRSLLVAEYIIRKSGIICGQQVLIDAANFSAGHVLRTPPTNLKTIVTFISDAYPVRVKKLIIYNAPPVLETMINSFVRPFMAEKLQQRLVVTRQNIDQVFEYVDELPSTYGGKKGDISDLSEQWENTLESWDYLPYLEEVVNEDIRPKTSRDCMNPYFGLNGSIKALVID